MSTHKQLIGHRQRHKNECEKEILAFAHLHIILHIRKPLNLILKLMRIFIFFISWVFTFTTCQNTQSKKLLTWQVPAYQGENYAKIVNPFIGTGGHGHTFPGAAAPFGMVQLSPDTRLEGWDGCSGYHYSDSLLYGFSHTHLSGTGVSDYGDVLLMPTVGKVNYHNGADGKAGYRSKFTHSKEKASAGFYSVFLEDYGVQADLTCSPRVGFHKYTFPEGKEANIILDLAHRDKILSNEIKIINSKEIVGKRISDAWAREQHIYFVIQFSEEFQKSDIQTDAKGSKAAFTFQNQVKKPILVKVGISAVSIEGARKNLQAEIPHWDFEKTRKQCEDAWNHELSKIQVQTSKTDSLDNLKTKDKKVIFYTALYHCFLAPNIYNDVDGNYRGRDLQVHHADHDYYTVFSLWDTFRALHPLFTIIQRKRTTDFIKTFLLQYQQGGKLPVWELAGNETQCMIGYHSVSVIADAYTKGIRDFDVELAYKAMKHSAMQDYFGLKSYKQWGFIPANDEPESVSKTLEYAYNDWCIAQIASALKKEKDFDYFIHRAQSYKNIFDPNTGFMRAKMHNRWFEPFSPEEVNFNFTEANSWQYSLFVPQDIGGLKRLLSHDNSSEQVIDNRFEQWLDNLFNASPEISGTQQADITGLIGQYAHGNEPSHHMAYLYNFVRKPYKTQEKVHQILTTLYQNAPDGLAGNEDCGQMSAWYVMSALGFYSVTPGTSIYQIGTPLFEKVNVQLENGKTFTIKAKNVSDKNFYIQSLQINGEKHLKQNFHFQKILDGGKFDFEMGEKPNPDWVAPKQKPLTLLYYLHCPVPYFGKSSLTFSDSQIISLEKLPEADEVYYALNQDKTFQLYQKPIEISETTTIKAFAKHKSPDSYSDTIQTTFKKIPEGRRIQLLTKYAPQYAASGDLALIDFMRGDKNYRTGTWQGYEEENVEAIVDLGKVQDIQKINVGFLQDQNAWIFMPLEVQLLVSEDGTNFQLKEKIRNTTDEKSEAVIIKDFSFEKVLRTRYLKIMGVNRQTCPTWHKGAGNKSWIFADEIEVF